MTKATPTDKLLLRPPQRGDLVRVLELLRACEVAQFGEAEATADDLAGEWSRSGFDLSADARLALAGGQVLGYAAVWARNGNTRFEGELQVAPQGWQAGAGEPLLRAAEGRAAARLNEAQEGASAALGFIAAHTDERARQLLERHAYRPLRHYWRMVIEMDAPPAEPPLPSGVTVRTFRAGDERAVYEAVQEAFSDNQDFVPISFEDWSNFTVARETFDPRLWFLAVEGEEIAGLALCPRYEGMGWVRQLGVRRPWRRRGLALALLGRVFAEFYRRGRRSVGLAVDSYNLSGAKELYERAGMRVARQHDSYEKELRAAPQRER